MTRSGARPGVSDAQALRMRDVMIRRGPDGAGLWRRRNVVLAHRRLAILDPSEAGAQPMLSAPGSFGAPDGEPRFALVYNGELYNDTELRRELTARGHAFRTGCDTETVLHAFAAWGTGAIHRLRGMFALGLYDACLDLLTLARDPLGVKPLYYALIGNDLVFASEPGAILAHPSAGAAPNPRMVSAYLTTIRTSLGDQTLFEGVHTLRPGQMLRCDLGSGAGAPRPAASTWWRGTRADSLGLDADAAAERTRHVIAESVSRQLRSDVPVCTLLSGGLDSSVITAVARAELPGLRTYCAGSPLPIDCSQDPGASDLAWARRVSAELGTAHAEAPVTRERFAERWPWMVGELGLPLSTPNEVAIHAVASCLREQGCVVTLSGEGADELFAGYEGPLDQAARFVAAGSPLRSPGLFELESNAWAPLDFKPGILNDATWHACADDRWLTDFYEREFAAASEEAGCSDLEAHLRFQRRVNLTGLLQRLDTATMLASVEGRTPFADDEVAAFAEALPMSLKYRPEAEDDAVSTGSGAIAVARSTGVEVRTKLVLRRAFAHLVPGAVLHRPKASFPLPFQQWVADHADALRSSGFSASIFTPAAIEAVASQPARLWHLAWPMMNLAMWGRAHGWD